MGFETPCSLTKNKLGRIPYGYDPSGQYETYNTFIFIFCTYFLTIILFPRWLFWDIPVTVGLRENTRENTKDSCYQQWSGYLLFSSGHDLKVIQCNSIPNGQKSDIFFSNKIDTPVTDAGMGLKGQPKDSGSKGILSLGRCFKLVKKRF